MSLSAALEWALSSRGPLIERLHAESTHAYRLFHGSVEGAPGLTVDRYGDLLLVQSFHAPLADDELADIEAFYIRQLPHLALTYNDRSHTDSRVRNPLDGDAHAAGQEVHVAEEMGVKYRIQARHAGQDPWLFLDLRAARRAVLAQSRGKSVLNLFAYTCGVGVCAAVGGATRSLNVDFAESSLDIGRENARLNGVLDRVECLRSDVFPAIRQLAGLAQSERVRGQWMPAFPKLKQASFDLVFLDPPRFAKSPFGVVDTVRDYQALLKPALLTTAIDGVLVCCNNVAQVEREEWRTQVERCAVKTGRAVREFRWIDPEDDFPSGNGRPPLKIAWLQL